jgi:hypothetical protein
MVKTRKRSHSKSKFNPIKAIKEFRRRLTRKKPSPAYMSVAHNASTATETLKGAAKNAARTIFNSVNSMRKMMTRRHK